MAVLAYAQVTLAATVDVDAVTTYYRLQASSSAAPSKPTVENPTGWTTTEPTYAGGSASTLYTCQRTDLTDGSWAWSDVSVSSSYEAAKAAWNKAQAAADAAAQTAALVRQYGAGVLVCREGNAVGALVNADGSFDVVEVTWSGGVPSAGSAVASFAEDEMTMLGGDVTFSAARSGHEGRTTVGIAASEAIGIISGNGSGTAAVYARSVAGVGEVNVIGRMLLDAVPTVNGHLLMLAPYTLYSSASGTTGDITLSDSAANYARIDVLYGTDVNAGGVAYKTATLYDPDGRAVSLDVVNSTDSASIVQWGFKSYAVSGTSMVVGMAERFVNLSSAAGAVGWEQASTQHVRVYAVYGYRW